jgi:hypothetical protein
MQKRRRGEPTWLKVRPWLKRREQSGRDKEKKLGSVEGLYL